MHNIWTSVTINIVLFISVKQHEIVEAVFCCFTKNIIKFVCTARCKLFLGIHLHDFYFVFEMQDEVAAASCYYFTFSIFVIF